ncbi:hypothetical protein GGX14DRAFT_664153 [Mycena pura]|uniref:Uncharacterized protein n=1 Tax=Mycena pura TaxID=153505 RepID=A0AAD7E0E4_9AGAR|nr:hypothetical protein GGX14DRAFT_664153 [Mycena pura]
MNLTPSRMRPSQPDRSTHARNTLETFRPQHGASSLPEKYSDLAKLHLPHVLCRASGPTTSLEDNHSLVSWTFPDDNLLSEVMLRFHQWVELHGDPIIDPALNSHWESVCKHIQSDQYTDEGRIFEICVLIVLLVSQLITRVAKTRGHNIYAGHAWSPLKNGVEVGKALCIFHDVPLYDIPLENPPLEPRFLSGVPVELKQDTTLLANLGAYVEGVNRLPDCETLEGGAAIFAKLDLQREGFLESSRKDGAESRYGAVFSGTHLVLVEWVEAEPRTSDGTMWMRHSAILDVAGRNPTTSFIAILIGILLPSSQIPYPPVNRDSTGFRALHVAMRR